MELKQTWIVVIIIFYFFYSCTHQLPDEAKELIKNNHIQDAINILEKDTANNNSNPFLYYSIGELYVKLNLITQAEKYFNKCLELDDGYRKKISRLYYKKAQSYFNNDDFSYKYASIALFEKSILYNNKRIEHISKLYLAEFENLFDKDIKYDYLVYELITNYLIHNPNNYINVSDKLIKYTNKSVTHSRNILPFKLSNLIYSFDTTKKSLLIKCYTNISSNISNYITNDKELELFINYDFLFPDSTKLKIADYFYDYLNSIFYNSDNKEIQYNLINKINELDSSKKELMVNKIIDLTNKEIIQEPNYDLLEKTLVEYSKFDTLISDSLSSIIPELITQYINVYEFDKALQLTKVLSSISNNHPNTNSKSELIILLINYMNLNINHLAVKDYSFSYDDDALIIETNDLDILKASMINQSIVNFRIKHGSVEKAKIHKKGDSYYTQVFSKKNNKFFVVDSKGKFHSEMDDFEFNPSIKNDSYVYHSLFSILINLI